MIVALYNNLDRFRDDGPRKMIKEGEVVELVCEEGYTRNIGVSTPNIIVIPTKYFVILKMIREIKVESISIIRKLQIGDWFIIN